MTLYVADQLQSKSTIRNQNREMSSKEADDLYSDLPAQLQKAVDWSKRKLPPLAHSSPSQGTWLFTT